MDLPGWYYVPGDPVDTVRRWDGTQWVGFAVPDPNAAARQGRIERPELSLPLGIASVFTIGALNAVVISAVRLLIAIRDGIGEIPVDSEDETLEITMGDVGVLIPDLGPALHTAALQAGVSVLIFGAWLYLAARATNTLAKREMTNPFASGVSRKIKLGPVAGWFAPRWLVATAPSGRFRNDPRTGVYHHVNMVAEAASRHHKRSIGPIKVLVWWILLWVAVISVALSWLYLSVVTPHSPSLVQSTLEFAQLGIALSIISIACLVATIIAITARLASRPSR